MAYVPLPPIIPPAGVTVTRPADEVGSLPEIVMDEAGASWAGGLLAGLDDLAASVSAQRSRLKKAIDAAADEAQRRIADHRAMVEGAYKPGLLGFLQAEMRGRKRSIDLLNVRLGLRAHGQALRRGEGPGEERAFVDWVEGTLGFGFVDYAPRLKWAQVVARLKGAVTSGIDGRAVDKRTGEVIPGLKVEDPRDEFYVRAAARVAGEALAAMDAAALNAAAATEDESDSERGDE